MQRTRRFDRYRATDSTNPRKAQYANLAIVMMSALMLLGIGVAVTQDQRAQARVMDAVASYQAPATIAPMAVPDRVAIIGDSYTGGSEEGGLGSDNWVSKVKPLIDHDNPIFYDVKGLGGSGYVSGGSAKKNFVDAVTDVVTPTTDVVVIFGSLNDRRAAGEVEDAAAKAYEYIERTAPEAQLVVIGPPAPYAEPTDVDKAIADEVRAAAEGHADVYVDPIADDWFDDNSIIGEDKVHPTDEGHTVMANLIAPALNEALSALDS